MPGQLSLLGLWQRQMKGADHQSAVNTANEGIKLNKSTLFLACFPQSGAAEQQSV